MSRKLHRDSIGLFESKCFVLAVIVSRDTDKILSGRPDIGLPGVDEDLECRTKYSPRSHIRATGNLTSESIVMLTPATMSW